MRFANASIGVVVMCACVLSVMFASCAPRPKIGEMVSLDLEGGGRLRYVAVMPSSVLQESPQKLVLALPSGDEDLAAVVSDVNDIWGDPNGRRAVGLVIPSSDTSTLLGRAKYAGFEFGADSYIVRILQDVEERFGLPQPRWTAADIGGNGHRLVKVLQQASERIDHAYLVPSFSIDEEAIGEAIRSDLKIAVVIGNRALNAREKRINSRSGSLAVRHTDLPCLFEVTKEEMTKLRRKYADFIVHEVSIAE